MAGHQLHENYRDVMVGSWSRKNRGLIAGCKYFLGGSALLLAGVVGAAGYGPGDQKALLTLEGAVSEAVAWHPSVDEASANADVSAENIAASKAGYLPQISVGLGSGYDNTIGSSWRPRASISDRKSVV